MNLRQVGVITAFELRQRVRSPLLIAMLVLSPLLSIITTFLPLSSFVQQSSVESRSACVALGGCSHSFLDSLNTLARETWLRDTTSLRLTVIPLSDHDDVKNLSLMAIADLEGNSPQLRIIGRNDRGLSVQEYLYALITQVLRHDSTKPMLAIRREYSVDDKQQSARMSLLLGALSLQLLSLSLVSGSAQLLVRSFFEERSSKVIDVVVSSTSPSTLLFAKYGSVLVFGLFHTAAWYLVVSQVAQHGFAIDFSSPGLVVSIHAYLCFVFFSALYLWIGAVVEKESTAQAASMLITMSLIVPLTFLLGSKASEFGATDSVLTLIPFTSMFVQGMRYLQNDHVVHSSDVLSYLVLVLATLGCLVAARASFMRRVQGTE